MNETKPNKPIALAVTLVILVICLMLNIVFISKNISHKQENQIRTGNTIVSLLENIKYQATFIDSYLTGFSQEVGLEDDQLLVYANDILKHELTMLKNDVAKLFLVTAAINADVLSEPAKEGHTPKLNAFLEALDATSYIKDMQLLSEIKKTVNEINEGTSKFNFKLAGSKTAMIRMSNGFEWTESLQLLDDAVVSK